MTATLLEDEAACARLCVDFANHLDARRYAQVLDLFTEDAALDRMGTVSAGREEIARFLAARPEDVNTRHVCSNIRVSFDAPDQATGVCYVLFFQGTGDAAGVAQLSGPPSVVEYHDRFLRTTGGWKILSRRIRMAIRG
ncbi:nuclear transport factor 2 family protein [Variovorax sp. J22G73]|uniref:nuclear transport factor 2 family protein n=1 Tax=unclassified Variovorax TaxID=663243 RepID=UPI00257825F5|nr:MULTISPECIES: nuclear transport factor 2 family protein [unclassified Variovorax]MDM0004931.1 nuclear transport factor 2 family protein [Variovorax sp. J22R203]MDM0098347.1 nuclear transport factor 2 family protein [Variovorax sp. J22G73]